MNLGIPFSIILATLLLGGFLLFGGALIPGHNSKSSAMSEVELITAEEDDNQDDTEPDEVEPEEVEQQVENPPDASEIIRNLETTSADAPALDAASLGAIEAALTGLTGTGGDFAQAMDFSSGGRIGGTGKADGMQDQMEAAFSLSEIDQKPRAVHQAAPMYPSEMRSKKIEGLVTVLFVVDSTGKVTNLRIEKSSAAAFEKPAIDAVKRWKFEPAVKGGERVACRMRVPIRFQPN